VSEHTPVDRQEEDIWRFLKKHPKFTNADVADACAASEWKRTNYLRSLRRKGILKPCGREGSTQYFTIFESQDVQIFAAKKRGVKEGAMWQAIRVLKVFTPDDLRVALPSEPIPVTPTEIQNYCSLLTRAKYLTVMQRARPGTRPARYRLINDTGPLPPIKRQLMVVVDGNEDRVIYAQGERI
jgi:hypothetical protein